MITLDGVRAAKRDLAADLSDDPRVRYLGVGFEGDDYVIMVAVAEWGDRPDLPEEFRGVPIKVVEASDFTAQTG